MRLTSSLSTSRAAHRRLWITIAVATVVLAGLATVRADGAVLTGRMADGRTPAPGAGITAVRAINPQTGAIVAAADVRRNGTWVMRLPNSLYTVLATVVRREGARQQAITPIVRVRGARPTTLRVSLRRKRAPKVRRRMARELNALSPHATSGAPVIAVKYLTGSPPNHMGKGISDLLINDLVQGSERCSPRVREWERIADVLAEIKLSNSRYGDPSTRIPEGHLLKIDLFVEGSLVEGADGSMSWNVQLRDAATGKIVGGDTSSTPPGGDWSAAEEQTAGRLLDQICGGNYDVNLALRTNGNVATHTSSGTLNATLTATGSKVGKAPPRVFNGTTTASYQDVTFTSKIPLCTFAAEPASPGNITFNLSITPAGLLHVTWDYTPHFQGTATMVCTDSDGHISYTPGMVGPLLLTPTPLEFDLPVDGGQQPISGGFQDGGDGWVHSGTIIISRRPPR